MVDQKGQGAVPGVEIVIGVGQFLDQGHDHTLDLEVVVVLDHMIDIEDIGVAGKTILLF